MRLKTVIREFAAVHKRHDGAEGAEKILEGIDSLLSSFLILFGVSDAKTTQILCAEGALIVRHPFSGSKAAKSGIKPSRSPID